MGIAGDIYVSGRNMRRTLTNNLCMVPCSELVGTFSLTRVPSFRWTGGLVLVLGIMSAHLSGAQTVAPKRHRYTVSPWETRGRLVLCCPLSSA